MLVGFGGSEAAVALEGRRRTKRRARRDGGRCMVIVVEGTGGLCGRSVVATALLLNTDRLREWSFVGLRINCDRSSNAEDGSRPVPKTQNCGDEKGQSLVKENCRAYLELMQNKGI